MDNKSETYHEEIKTLQNILIKRNARIVELTKVLEKIVQVDMNKNKIVSLAKEALKPRKMECHCDSIYSPGCENTDCESPFNR